MKTAKSNKKYKLLLAHDGLYRIRALRSFGDVEAGDLGGYVSSEANLSHEGDAWIYDNAKVTSQARVSGNAIVSDNVLVTGEAQISGNAQIRGWARIAGTAKINGDASITTPRNDLARYGQEGRRGFGPSPRC